MGKKTLLQNVGTSIDDHPYIQFYVDIECVVFTPKVDKKVRAVVNKVGETFIGKRLSRLLLFLQAKINLIGFLKSGCLICGKINATVFKHKKVKKEGEIVTSEQQMAENAINGLKIGNNVLIKIKSIQYEHNNLFLVASFVDLLE
jgi:hypothetical protein